MRLQMLSAILGLLLLTGACSAMEETMVSALFQNYISAQEALAEDNPERAKEALSALVNEAQPEIGEIALEAVRAKDLPELRKKFKALSGKLEKLELPEGYIVAYCPMADDGKGATWVQKQGEIKNPYLGEAMPSCGEVKKGSE